MQPIVVADSRISEAEYVAISTRLHQRQRWATLGLTTAFLACMMWSDGGLNDPTQVLISVSILACIAALAWWMGRRRFRKQYTATPSVQLPTSYTLTADGIATRSPLGESFISWSNVQAVRPVNNWFVFTTSPGVYIPIDGRCVQAPHTATDLATALTQRGTNLSPSSTPSEAAHVSVPVGPVISIPNVHLTLGQYTWLSLRLTAKIMPLIWVLLLPLGSALLVLWQLLLGDKTLGELWQNNSGQLLMMLFFLSVPLFMLWAIRKQYRNSPLLKHPANYLLTPDKMLVAYPGANAEISWDGVQKVNRIGRWTFLQTTAANAGFILDMRQVASPNTAADVFALFKTQHIVVK
ncbi:YcxB family protein [Hymenobacter sp. BT186]|uniref:YcxB family protein n=2 Tax=Hymenobacter telluris TaxID=2816474 RepID=A0A939EYW0_9BACT|nr:YcxB family protein [Hymenobacter telluris]